MSAQSRVYLKEGFDDGERPTGKDFADIFDSFINFEDDKVALDANKNLSIPAGVSLLNSPSGPNGTIRFNGTEVQLSIGGVWSPIAGESGAFVKVGAGPHVAFAAGNVGVGNFAVAPTHKLEIPLAGNTSTNERIRLGKLVAHNGLNNDAAYISHESHTSDTNYALKQDAAANTFVNCGGASRVVLNQGNVTRMQILTSGNISATPQASMTIEGNTVIGTSGVPRIFQVHGDARKTVGGPFDPIASDLRVKKDVKPFDLGLKELCQLSPVYYKFNGDAGLPNDERQHVGLIAQDIQQVIPSMVRKSDVQDKEHKELLTYDSGPLTFILINAIRELTERVEKLETQLAAKKTVKH